MASTTTKRANVIVPEVMGDMIEAKIEAQCKLTPYAKVDNTLEGTAGDTKTVPSWNYVGDAVDFNPETAYDNNTEMETTRLTAGSRTFTVKCAGKSISVLQTAINGGMGDPIGQANTQLAKSITNKVDNDLLDAIYDAEDDSTYPCVVVDGSSAYIGYAGIVNAVTKFEDEEDGIEKVMFIHPAQEASLLTDSQFISADKFTAGVAVRGAIGMVAGCWIKKSKKIRQDETTHAWLNPIIKMEPDSAETEYTEDELPALTIFLKKGTQVDHEWFPKKQRHDITATKYYGVAVTNASKLIIAKFKGDLRA
jgi:N4-gp56 family major capsid protein